ncbi:hypothetical protein TVAG_140110 [Trichomonas vaginalis G3]|uniref:Uncharacterized protein n=1 Tax=Trichomonas vaginalis (strain ATCC PRA-98 / G3) TaxID=412133 RepID=A2F6F4_TRIV3|nr:hypothetical protein TVAGG3_0415240 [Trichomonas vaginalis G3]EAX99512.1 hypothetical protein TVAG_140110 [Trichomonas vaginalis G3]KAI5535647.1 hypothetical protein TVAGG3_0415240 [Trichomonas vaginalis G3]|eukprot:XP_001312442.1 hypothetical protein [Trichomonas vaginalis G3]
MFVLFALAVLDTVNIDLLDTPPPVIPDRTPEPSGSPLPSPTRIIVIQPNPDSNKVSTWLIVCTTIICVIIVITIVSVIVLCFRQNKGEIYAHNTSSTKQHEAGTVEIRSIYSVQKSIRATAAK